MKLAKQERRAKDLADLAEEEFDALLDEAAAYVRTQAECKTSENLTEAAKVLRDAVDGVAKELDEIFGSDPGFDEKNSEKAKPRAEKANQGAMPLGYSNARIRKFLDREW